MNEIYKKKQKMILFSLMTVALIFFCGILPFLFEDASPAKAIASKMDLPSDKINPQDLWMTKVEGENKIIDQKLKYLEDLILENKKKDESKTIENNNLKSELAQLKNQLKSISEAKDTVTIQNSPALSIDPFASKQNTSLSASNDTFFRDDSRVVVIEKSPLTEIVAEISKSKVLCVDKYIPAGTTVKAVLVSSIDAPCGVFTSSDPQPVKIRILDNGHLPKGVNVNMKGSIIIASVHGDLSSERVYMRIERLTQVKENGDFIETEVTGFVTGEDGKYGVRGTVVDKSLNMVGNAAISGFFSGINQYLQAKANRGWISTSDYETVESQGGNILMEGGIGGTGSAFDKLSEYYIKRAEQIRPVIQVTAGRIIDITFTHGTEIGDLHVKDKIKELRLTSRKIPCKGQ